MTIVQIAPTCRFCKRTVVMNVPLEGFEAWQAGKLIQDALPDLSLGERELLISGICGKCFDQMFKGGNE